MHNNTLLPGWSNMHEAHNDRRHCNQGYSTLRPWWRDLGDVGRACRSALPPVSIRLHDGVSKVGQHQFDSESDEWVRLTNEVTRNTALVKRRTLEQHKSSGIVGLLLVGLGLTGMVVEMYWHIPSYMMYLSAGLFLGVEMVTLCYEKP
jgi:hypothetical protein